MNINDLLVKFSYDDIYSAYIVDNTKQVDMPEKFGITAKDVRKLLDYYGIKKDPKQAAKNNTYKRTHEEYLACGKKSAETQKKHWAEKPKEEKEAWAEYCREVQLNLPEEVKQKKVQKANTTYQNKSQEEKDTINSKRSKSCKEVWVNPLTKQKYNDTLHKNREARKQRLCRSLIEQNIYTNLVVEFPDLIYDAYIGDKYPFSCDFYLPSLDLFIEIQGHPSHGNVPYGFNEESYIRANELTGKWKQIYIEADVNKYNTAVKNNVNLIRLYPCVSLETNYEINQNKYKDIIKLLYESK